MYVQPQTFITRMLEHSQLSPGARLVALVIAERRFRRRLKPDEPLPLTVADLARDCNRSPRGVQPYIAECVESGWIPSRSVYRDGRQQPTEYYLADPTETGTATVPRRRGKPLTQADRDRLAARRTPEPAVTGGRPLPTETAAEPPNTVGNGLPIIGGGLHPVLRSKYKSEDAAPPKGGRVPSEQGVPEPAAPPPPAAAAVQLPHPAPSCSIEEQVGYHFALANLIREGMSAEDPDRRERIQEDIHNFFQSPAFSKYVDAQPDFDTRAAVGRHQRHWAEAITRHEALHKPDDDETPATAEQAAAHIAALRDSLGLTPVPTQRSHRWLRDDAAYLADQAAASRSCVDCGVGIPSGYVRCADCSQAMRGATGRR